MMANLPIKFGERYTKRIVSSQSPGQWLKTILPHSIRTTTTYLTPHYLAYVSRRKYSTEWFLVYTGKLFWQGDICLFVRSSISLHLSAIYRYEGTFGKIDWNMNLDEFKRRFDHSKGATYLKNLYFVYLLEMRAFAKAAPYLSKLQYFTGNREEDDFMKESISKLLDSVVNFPMHFDETQLFKGERASILKEEFRSRFHNVTTIIDCAACEKCRLWGKLQTHGLGTALKVFRCFAMRYLRLY